MKDSNHPPRNKPSRSPKKAIETKPATESGQQEPAGGAVIVSELLKRSGKDIVKRILEDDNPSRLVRHLSGEDLFWLVRKSGEDECLPMLKLASVDQWRFMLDLDIWREDRIELKVTKAWLRRLMQADPTRFVKWLCGEGELLAHFLLNKSVEVWFREEDQDVPPPEGFRSLDGIVYLRVLDEDDREMIEGILKLMAAQDFERYLTVVQELGFVLPSQTEEEMYRMRNVRLAEHGILPLEEALSVYAPLDSDVIAAHVPSEGHEPFPDEDRSDWAPVAPLQHVEGSDMLMEAASRISDPMMLDKIRVEFSALSNQILSADGLPLNEPESLIRTCRKAAGYLNITLENLCSGDYAAAERILSEHPLVHVFRAGYGLALKLKWQAEGWVKESWFHGKGLPWTFWGDDWGRILAGLLSKRPRFYVGLGGDEEYRDFQKFSELEDCREVLHRLMVLDKLLERLTTHYPVDSGLMHAEETTCTSLLFTLWARETLELEPMFRKISLDQARRVFDHITKSRKQPPHGMPILEERFVGYFLAYTMPLGPGEKDILEDSLKLMCEAFREEYQWLSTKDLDERYSKFILVGASKEPRSARH